MSQYRLCLAPLRFGAGLKGKIVDSWFHQLPVVTTPIGAEGMIEAGEYASPLRSDPYDFCRDRVQPFSGNRSGFPTLLDASLND